MITRIVKLPKHDDVLIGRDLAKIFKNGHVYGVSLYFNEIVVSDLGETALPEIPTSIYPNQGSTIDSIMVGNPSLVYFTKKEYEDYLKKQEE